jgi:hypothetical protein
MGNRFVAVHSTLPTSVMALLAEADHDLRERATLLKRASEMVRGETRRSPTRGLSESKPTRVVQIHHDLDDAAFVATDAQSGLSVLRHQDSARLRAMCARIGWQVVGGGGAAAHHTTQPHDGYRGLGLARGRGDGASAGGMSADTIACLKITLDAVSRDSRWGCEMA